MNAVLRGDIEMILRQPAKPVKWKRARPLTVACRMLSGAQHMTATTVVGVLDWDDVDAFRALVADISAKYGLDTAVNIQEGSYSVRFCHRTRDATGR